MIDNNNGVFKLENMTSFTKWKDDHPEKNKPCTNLEKKKAGTGLQIIVATNICAHVNITDDIRVFPKSKSKIFCQIVLTVVLEAVCNDLCTLLLKLISREETVNMQNK